MNRSAFILCITILFLILLGCRQNGTSDITYSEQMKLENAQAWFNNFEVDYDVCAIQQNGNDFVLLTTFEPPGVDGLYTMVRLYIIEENGDSYVVKELKDAYAAGSAGFSAELLHTSDMTILFGDIGFAVYDFKIDGMREVTFTEAIVELSDGNTFTIPLKNNSPYMIILEESVIVTDITYKTNSGDIRYSEYFAEGLSANCNSNTSLATFNVPFLLLSQ